MMMMVCEFFCSGVHEERWGAGCRDNTSHPHFTASLGPHVWVVDLGCDSIYHYRHAPGHAPARQGVTKVGGKYFLGQKNISPLARWVTAAVPGTWRCCRSAAWRWWCASCRTTSR